MSIHFTREMSCWFYKCARGCSGFDYEGQQEARDAFNAHKCPGRAS